MNNQFAIVDFLLADQTEMRGNKQFILALFWIGQILDPGLLFCQVDTILTLPQIEVVDSKIAWNQVGSASATWDTLGIEDLTDYSVASILEQESGVYIKNYGPGSIATSTIRGAGASQTQVRWNGITITNSMLGQSDLSLLPPFLIDYLGVTYGSGSTPFGSGAIGGTIHLNNLPRYHSGKSILFGTQVGSYGYLNPYFKFGYGSEKISGSLRLHHQQAHNKFDYKVGSGLSVKQQTHASYNQTSGIKDFYIRLKDDQEIRLHIWGQKSDRDIPPTTTQSSSEASQKDNILRSSIQWLRFGKKLYLQARIAYLNEQNIFKDQAILLKSVNNFQKWIFEFEGNHVLSKGKRIYFGLNQSLEKTKTNNYQKNQLQPLTSLFGMYRWEIPNLRAQIHLRQELVRDNFSPFIPGFAMEMKFAPWGALKTKIQRNFRHPSLNDLYWVPGGNPDLKAEGGWSGEFGIVAQIKNSNQKFHWESSSTYFTRKIRDWILWVPNENTPYWSPRNIALVYSRGIEQRLKANISLPLFNVEGTAGYDYTLSSHEKSIDLPMIKAGEQIWYVPRHRSMLRLRLSRKNWTCSYRHQFTGQTTGLLDILPGYSVGSLFLGKGIKVKNNGLQFNLKFDNIWNVSYRIVERRPMPGRQILLNCLMYIN